MSNPLVYLLLVLSLLWAERAQAVPGYPIKANDCGHNDEPRTGHASVVEPLAAVGPADALWVVTALHVVYGCADVALDMGNNGLLPLTGPVRVWQSQDMIAFQVQRAALERHLIGTPGRLRPASCNDVCFEHVFVWTDVLDPKPTAKVKADTQGFTRVGDIAAQLKRKGFRQNSFGSLSPDNHFLRYQRVAYKGDSGAALTADATSKDVIGIHMAGIGPAESEDLGLRPDDLLINWGLVFTEGILARVPELISFDQVANRAIHFVEPAIQDALRNDLRRPRAEPGSRRSSGYGPLFWTGVTVALVGVVGSTVFWYLGEERVAEIEADCPATACDDGTLDSLYKQHNIASYDKATNWFLVGAGIGASTALGAVLWHELTPSGRERSSNTALLLTPFGLRVEGNF